jgi:ABC-type glycerol-3-phosphate transport system substrate-binding protein
MRNKKLFFVLNLFLIIALVLSACGGSSDSKSSEGSASPSTGSSASAGKDSLKAYEGTTLRVLLKEGYEINVIQKYVSDFEKQTGIKVKLEVYDEPTARQKYILDATSKTGAYDVTAISFWYFPEYQKNGWVEPLDELMKNSNPEWYHPEDIPVSALDTFSADGKRYAMPHTIISGMSYYRKDIFEKHKLEAPKTTQDMIALASKLKQLEPGMMSITGRGAPNFASLGTYLGWAWGYGAQLLDDQFKPHANSPEMVQALTDYVNMLKDYGPKDAASLNHVQAGEKMQSGNAAMMFDTTGWGTILEDPKQSKVNGKIGYSMIQGPAGRPLQWIYMEGLGINSASKNKEAAWLFLQWRMSRETTMKELTELSRSDVPNLYVLNSPEYQAFAEKNNITEFTKLLPEAWKAADIKYWPFVPEFAEIGDAFMTQISAAIAGQKDVPKALDEAQKSIEDILTKAGY